MKYPVYVLKRDGLASHLDTIIYFANVIKANDFITTFNIGGCYAQAGWKT
jgi:hypothetical protein